MNSQYTTRGIWIVLLALFFSIDTATAQGVKITASDAAPNDNFGNSVAISGNRIIVGAFQDDDGAEDAGSVYIYDFDGTNWNETKLTANDGIAFANFGQSVDISGDRAIVGAYHDDAGAGLFSGSAYIYDFDGTNWNETKLTASDGAANDEFGRAVALDGDRAIIGAMGDENRTGSAYVYEFNSVLWVETKLTDENGAPGDEFGHSVAIDGDRIVVGAPGDDGFIGGVFTFEHDGVNWNGQKITAGDGASDDIFGFAVDVDGDDIVVGAPGEDNFRGSIYHYGFVDGEWTRRSTCRPDVIDDGDQLGLTAVIHRDQGAIYATAPGHNFEGANAGGSWEYNEIHREIIDHCLSHFVRSEGVVAGDEFGNALDIDADAPNVKNLVFGIHSDDEAGLNAGSVFVLYTHEDTDTDIETLDGIPTEFALDQNFPNPFNPSTVVNFALSEPAHVRLSVYDILGREVRTLISGNLLVTGHYQVTFEADGLPSGTYLYRIETSKFTSSRVMHLAK